MAGVVDAGTLEVTEIQEKGVDQETLSTIDTNVSRLLENNIGKAIMSGGKRIGYIVSFTDRSSTMPREDAFGIFSDGVMSIIEKPSGGFPDKFNETVRGNQKWVVNENMTPQDFRKFYKQDLSANHIHIIDSTDSDSPQSVERVMSTWSSIIKPEIARARERRGTEVKNKRIADSARAVAADLKEMFNLSETPIASNGSPAPSSSPTAA